LLAFLQTGPQAQTRTIQPEVPRVLQHILRALQISLSCVGIFLLWNLVSPLARGLATSDLPALELAQADTPAVAAGDYQVIGARNLFKSREAAPVAAPSAEIEAAPTQLRIQLLGTVAGGSDVSSGIIRDGSTSKVEVIQVGDEVAGGQAKVVRIERRRILVDHQGVIEAVQLEEQQAKGLSLRTTSSYDPSHGEAQPDRMRQLLEQRMAQNLIQKINEADAAEVAAAETPDAATAANVPAARFERSDNGAIAAIQMQQVTPDSGLARLGFAPGDRLVALDGVRLNDPAMPRRFATLLASDRATVVEVERGGVPTQIQIPADSVPQLIREIGVAR
jgi:type II secretion system protein C